VLAEYIGTGTFRTSNSRCQTEEWTMAKKKKKKK